MPNPGNPSVIVDDRSSLIKYDGQWDPNGIGEEFQGTTSTSHTAGSTATFTFDGTSIVVYGTINPDAGTSMGFAIDKTITGNFSTPATLPSALLHQALYTSPQLPAGSHTLVITHSTTTPADHIFLDYLVYTPSPDSDSNGLTYLVDDNNPVVQYTNWKPVQNPRRVLQTQHQSGGDGAKITLPFEGTGISIFGDVPRRLVVANLATISVDNGPATNFAPPIQILSDFTFNQQIFNSPKLSQGNHTLTLSTVGTDSLLIDYFLVTPGEITRPTASPSSSSSSSSTASSTQTSASTTKTSTTTSSTTTPSHSAAASNNSSSTTKAAAIAGGTVGGIILLALLVAAFIIWRKRRADQRDMADLISLTSERYVVQPFTPLGPTSASHAYPPSQPPSQYAPSAYQPSSYGGSNHAGYGAGAGYADQQASYPAYNPQRPMTVMNPAPPVAAASVINSTNYYQGSNVNTRTTGGAAISEKDPRYRPGPAYLYEPQNQHQPVPTNQSVDPAAAYDGYEPGPSDLPYASSRPSSPGDHDLPNPHDTRPPPTYTLHSN